MQKFLVRAAMDGCLRAQRDHRRRLLDESTPHEGTDRPGALVVRGMEDGERERKEEGSRRSRRVVLALADSTMSISPQC